MNATGKAVGLVGVVPCADPGAAAPISCVPVNNGPWHVDEDWRCGAGQGQYPQAGTLPLQPFPPLLVKSHKGAYVEELK